LPDFVIIGAMKAGTTSLFMYLDTHPQISRCRIKEPSFFSDHAWDKGLPWYQSLYQDNDALKFEASTSYTRFPKIKYVPERMKEVVPKVKLIYVIRHPIDRIISQLHHMIIDKKLPADAPIHTTEFWETHGLQCVMNSHYYLQLSEYLKYFGRERIHVIKFEDLVLKPAEILNHILMFLGIKEDFFSEDMVFKQFNERSTRAFIKYPVLHRILSAASRRGLLPAIAPRLAEVPVKRPVLTGRIREFLWDHVRDDLAQLEFWLGYKLDYQLSS